MREKFVYGNIVTVEGKEKKVMTEEIRQELMLLADEKYREFNRSLVPGEILPMVGVRMPELRKIAKRLAKNEITPYMEAEAVSHEELLLQGMMIGYAKLTKEDRSGWLDRFVPQIDNWAVCDSCCMTYKFMKTDQEFWYRYLHKYLTSAKEYEIRFAVVAFLDHFINEAYIDRLFVHFSELHHEAYYVRMAVAWAVSVCYVKFPEKTEAFLMEDRLDDFTHNKAIQKIRESYRVSQEDKERLKGLKRK